LAVHGEAQEKNSDRKRHLSGCDAIDCINSRASDPSGNLDNPRAPSKDPLKMLSPPDEGTPAPGGMFSR
jgi:hypothetical protein